MTKICSWSCWQPAGRTDIWGWSVPLPWALIHLSKNTHIWFILNLSKNTHIWFTLNLSKNTYMIYIEYPAHPIFVSTPPYLRWSANMKYKHAPDTTGTTDAIDASDPTQSPQSPESPNSKSLSNSRYLPSVPLNSFRLREGVWSLYLWWKDFQNLENFYFHWCHDHTLPDSHQWWQVLHERGVAGVNTSKEGSWLY